MSDDGDQTPLLRRSPHTEQTDQVSKLTPFLTYVALVVNLVPISAGLVLGYSSPAIVALETDPEIQLTPNQASLFGSIPCLTAAIGSIVGALINSKLGRKPAMLATSPIFTIGWILLAFGGRNIGLLILGRAFGGLAMGVCFVVAPGYIAEISPAAYRGLLGTFFQVAVNVGILIAYVLGRYFSYQWLAIYSILPVALFSITALNIPESPRFLLTNQKRQEAKSALAKLRGSSLQDISHELQQMEEQTRVQDETEGGGVGEGDRGGSSVFGFLNSQVKKRAFMLASSVLLLQQASGINIVVFYTESIYTQAGVQDTNMASIYFALSNILATIAASRFIDTLGRKKLLSISSAGMSFFLALFAFYFHSAPENRINWIGMACPIGYVIFFAFGFGPIPWVVVGEILPNSIKVKSSAIANVMTWTFSFLLTSAFQSVMVPVLGTSGTFGMFSVTVVCSALFLAKNLVETKGKTLEEIEGLLAR